MVSFFLGAVLSALFFLSFFRFSPFPHLTLSIYQCNMGEWGISVFSVRNGGVEVCVCALDIAGVCV